MSIEAMAIALNHSKAKGAAKIVLLGICNHINPDNDGAWPSQERLADYANISDRAVRYAIEQLVELGEIRFEVAAGNSRNQYKPNRYWLTLNCPDDCDKSASHRRVEIIDRVEVSDNQGGKNLQSGWKQASDEPYIEPLEEPLIINTMTEAKSNRGSRFREDAVLTDEMRLFVLTDTPYLNAEKVFEGFKDYWISMPGSSGVRSNWMAVWRNWCRRQQVPRGYVNFKEKAKADAREKFLNSTSAPELKEIGWGN